VHGKPLKAVKGPDLEKDPPSSSDKGYKYVVCPKSSCSGLAEEWDVDWWGNPPALFTQQDPVDVQ
jgi:hypothetical protein